MWIDGTIWIPAYHPAYILRNRSNFGGFVESLRYALALRWGTNPLPTPPWEQVTLGETPGKDIGAAIKRKGYAFFYSRTLKTQVVVLRNEGSKYPMALAHLPRYTVDELVHVGIIGKGRNVGWTNKALQTLNMVKHELDGIVISG